MDRANLGYTTPPEDYVDTIKIEEGDNTLRFVLGPAVKFNYWYPSFKENEDGIFEKRNRGVKSNPESKSILHEIYASEWNKLKSLGIEKKDANFLITRSKEYLYLAFDLKDELAVLRPIRIPYSVHQRIDQFIKETYTDAPQFLKNGLLFMFDVKITKTINKNIKERKFATKYTTDVYETYAPKKTLPVTLLTNQANWLNIVLEQNEGLNIGWETFFSEQQLAAIDNSEQDPETMYPYKTNQEVIEELKENPILFDDTLNHFDPEGLCDILKQLSVPVARQLPAPTPKKEESGDNIPETELHGGTSNAEQDFPETSVDNVEFEEEKKKDEEGDGLPDFIS